MEQEHNPNRNAELSMEQNGNMIDGIINNLPVLPRSEKPLDKVREHPPKRRSRERESVDKKAAALCPSSCDGDARGAGVDR